jgi:ubiquinone/menaquinone biosynthesis C-methylase UbiE
MTMTIASSKTQAYKDERASLSTLDSAEEIRSLFMEAKRQGVFLMGALNRRADREIARVTAVEGEHLVLEVQNFQERSQRRHRLSMELEGKLLSFEADYCGERSDGTREFLLPRVLFVVERREVERARSAFGDGRGPRVCLELKDGRLLEGQVIDEAASGLGLMVSADVGSGQQGWMRIRFLEGTQAGREVFGEIRHRVRDEQRGTWTRIGVRLSAIPSTAFTSVERVKKGRTRGVAGEVAVRLGLARALVLQSARTVAERVAGRRSPEPEIPIVDFRDDRGERIRAIIDYIGSPVGAPAVIMPPAWGKTKETLSPLAETILETFRRAGEAVVVARYDGIRRKGESFNEPDCLAPGREFTKFTISQALRDIRSMLDFLTRSPEFRCRTAILVTFSASAIEGRRSVAMEREGRIGGWISVVGAPDLQYAMRVLSGGIDYYGGLRRGFRFGEREVLGTRMNIDLAGLDAIESGIASLEDARRDMAQIQVPVTWIHGRHDGWMSLERVCDILGCGDSQHRRLIEIPTGHQLKTSREALDTFQLIASEIGRMALGRPISGALPDLDRLERRRMAERERLPRAAVDLRGIWKEYLVGRDGRLGIELMTASEIYEELMLRQVEGLRLFPGCRVADLGSGTGALASFVGARDLPDGEVRIDQLDLVREGLVRSRERMTSPLRGATRVRITAVVADLNVRGGRLHVPLESACYDRVHAGLLLSYLDEPAELLAEARRILKPGGRLVLSSLRRDADISKIYRDGIAEMSREKVARLFGPELAHGLEDRLRRFLNDGARILDLEERGYFRFWDEDELAAMVRNAGFSTVRAQRAFGWPPQAVVVSAERR